MLKYIFTGYIESALLHAVYEKLEDGSYSGQIPACTGVIAFDKSLKECEQELQSTLEDWILVGLKLGHHIPIIDNFDLNKQPDESLVSV